MKIFKKDDQKGQSIMEYLILTTLVGLVCLSAVKQFGRKIDKKINEAKSAIVNEIKF